LIAHTILATWIRNASNECSTWAREPHVLSPDSLRSIAYTSIKPLCMRVLDHIYSIKKPSLTRGFSFHKSTKEMIYGEIQSGGVSSSMSLSMCLAISPSVILSPIASCM